MKSNMLIVLNALAIVAIIAVAAHSSGRLGTASFMMADSQRADAAPYGTLTERPAARPAAYGGAQQAPRDGFGATGTGCRGGCCSGGSRGAGPSTGGAGGASGVYQTNPTQAQIIERVRTLALEYYAQTYGDKDASASVRDFGCHQEADILKNGAVIKTLSISGNRIMEI